MERTEQHGSIHISTVTSKHLAPSRLYENPYGDILLLMSDRHAVFSSRKSYEYTQLTPSEFCILDILMSNPFWVYSPYELNIVSATEHEKYSQVPDDWKIAKVHVSRTRAKIGDEALGNRFCFRFISIIPGIDYTLTPDPSKERGSVLLIDTERLIYMLAEGPQVIPSLASRNEHTFELVTLGTPTIPSES